MRKNVVLEVYLRNLIQFCETYDAALVPAAMMSGGTEIRLQDIYTHIKCVSREEYELKIDALSNNGVTKTIQKEYRNTNIDSKSNADKSDKLSFESSSSCESSEQASWIWYLAEPGGGKTTLLKMYCLAYAYKYYIELFGRNEEAFSEWQSIETVCDALGVIDGSGVCPVFISARDLKEEDYSLDSEYYNFDRVTKDIVTSLVEDEISDFDVEAFLESLTKSVYIVDGVEELPNINFRNEFLKCLYIYSRGSQCILSSRYREYMENIRENALEINGNKLTGEEYVIDGLSDDLVKEFATKWYDALSKVSGQNDLDYEKDFLTPLSKNSNAKSLVSNPLELTNLLMISSYDSTLPSNLVEIYARSIELWLSWANTDSIYYGEDVLRQLSQIAFQMAISDNEKIVVSYQSLSKYIKNARIELDRYYKLEWTDDNQSVDEFIQFLVSTHLLNKSKSGYEFIHRQYQAYLVAHCISTNNFSPETRKQKSGLSYLKKYIRQKDDFWNQIYELIAIMNSDLRNEIVTTLLVLSKEDISKEDISLGEPSYYVSRLIDLAIIPGADFDDYECCELFDLLFNKANNWQLFRSKRADLQELISVCSSHNKEVFVDFAINKSKKLGETDKEIFRDKVATVVFYCIWQHKLGASYIEKVLLEFFANYIDSNIMEMIHSTYELNSNQLMVRDIAASIGRQALKTSGFLACYMILAAIIGYEGDRDPYNCVDRLIDKGDFESSVLAINILFIAAWLNKNFEGSRCLGYAPVPLFKMSEKWSKYSDFITNGIVDDKHREMQEYYLSTYFDVIAIGGIICYENMWFKEYVFESVLRKALSEYTENGSLFVNSTDSFVRYFQHVSLYPCEYSEICKKVLVEFNVDTEELSSKLRHIYETASDKMNILYAAKLMIMVSDMTYYERMKLVHYKSIPWVEFANGTRKLRDKSLILVAFHISRQLRDYLPEKRSIIDELDFTKFTIDSINNDVL